VPLFVQTEAADGAAGSLASRPTVVLGAHRQSDAGSTRKARRAQYYLVASQYCYHKCEFEGHTSITHSELDCPHSDVDRVSDLNDE
jgi:hypothetical protein